MWLHLAEAEHRLLAVVARLGANEAEHHHVIRQKDHLFLRARRVLSIRPLGRAARLSAGSSFAGRTIVTEPHSKTISYLNLKSWAIPQTVL